MTRFSKETRLCRLADSSQWRTGRAGILSDPDRASLLFVSSVWSGRSWPWGGVWSCPPRCAPYPRSARSSTASGILLKTSGLADGVGRNLLPPIFVAGGSADSSWCLAQSGPCLSRACLSASSFSRPSQIDPAICPLPILAFRPSPLPSGHLVRGRLAFYRRTVPAAGIFHPLATWPAYIEQVVAPAACALPRLIIGAAGAWPCLLARLDCCAEPVAAGPLVSSSGAGDMAVGIERLRSGTAGGILETDAPPWLGAGRRAGIRALGSAAAPLSRAKCRCSGAGNALWRTAHWRGGRDGTVMSPGGHLSVCPFPRPCALASLFASVGSICTRTMRARRIPARPARSRPPTIFVDIQPGPTPALLDQRHQQTTAGQPGGHGAMLRAIITRINGQRADRVVAGDHWVIPGRP